MLPVRIELTTSPLPMEIQASENKHLFCFEGVFHNRSFLNLSIRPRQLLGTLGFLTHNNMLVTFGRFTIFPSASADQPPCIKAAVSTHPRPVGVPE